MGRKSDQSKKATRPGEYLAFFTMTIPTKEGLGYAFLACDAFSQFGFSIGVEPSESPEMVLKNIYLLTENPEFIKLHNAGFTLVLKDFHDLKQRIESIINPINGNLIYDEKFNNHIAAPLKRSFQQFLKSI